MYLKRTYGILLCILWVLVIIHVSVVVINKGNAITTGESTWKIVYLFITRVKSERPDIQLNITKVKHNVNAHHINSYLDYTNITLSGVHQTMHEVLLNSNGEFHCENTEKRGISELQITDENSAYSMSTVLRGRMGSWMFKYAALLGISSLTGHKPVLHPDFSELKVIFPSLTVPLSYDNTELKLLREDKFNVTNSILCIEKYARGRHVDLLGSFEKHIYFEHIRDQIRHEFAFNDQIQQQASAFFTHAIPDYNTKDIITVGMHFRLGDKFHNPKHKNTSIMRTSYFINAMDYFANKHRREQLYFVFISDEQDWVTKNIIPLTQRYNDQVVRSLDNSPAVDLAILAACSHTVISVGTFSWWGAWLSMGTTVYYSGLPRPGYETLTHPGTVFIPPPADKYSNWVPIGD